MHPDARAEDIYEERVARYLELAEAAQEAAGRCSSESLEHTYVQLARQWIHLADTAKDMFALSQSISQTMRDSHPHPAN